MSHAQWISDSVNEAHITKGINCIYNLSFDSARSEFRFLTSSQPENPAGYFFLAMVEWWRILIDLNNKEHDKYYYSVLEKVIELCDKKLEQNPDDLGALFFKGGAIGFRGRLRSHREEWLLAANDGRLAIPIVHQAYKIAPNNLDVLLGMGIYNYYRDVIPEEYPFVKPFVIFFPAGDKVLGIQQLRQTSEKARYANVEATYFLVQLLYKYEKNYNEALTLVSRLHQQYPANSVFHIFTGRLYSSLGKWEEMNNIFTEVMSLSRAKKIGYNETSLREANYSLGLYQMNFNKHESALEYFYKCDELSRNLDAGEQSWFMAMSNLKIGMIYDLQHKRDLAIMQYDKVLNMTDCQNSHDLAKKFKEKPYGNR
jgi:tetratricopeptide (TPR) repeat protein